MTASVDLLETGETVEVRSEMTPRLWRLCVEIDEHRDDLAAVEDELVDGVLEVIVRHDDPGYSFEDREVWEAVVDEWGVDRVGDAFEQLVTPALESVEESSPLQAIRDTGVMGNGESRVSIQYRD